MDPDPLGRESFIRKGMARALRERNRTAPDEVQAFCAKYRHSLSALTLREALRGVRRQGTSGSIPGLHPASTPRGRSRMG